MYKITKAIPLIFLIFLLNNCQNGQFFKRSDVKDNPVNVEERIQKNIDEGRGVRFGKLLGKEKGGIFDFASSNELWRATVEILDFVPLTNASYSGGIIITDWFNGGAEDSNRNLKITVKFLSNEIRSDSVKVDVHEKICINLNNCTTKLIKSNVSNDIKVAILKKQLFLKKIKSKRLSLKIRKKDLKRMIKLR